MHCCRPHRARRLVHKARAPFRGPGSMGSHPQGRTNTNPRDTERPQRHENQQKGPRKKRRAVRGCPRPSPSTSLKRSARACGARAALALYREGPGLDCKILLEAKKFKKRSKVASADVCCRRYGSGFCNFCWRVSCIRLRRLALRLNALAGRFSIFFCVFLGSLFNLQWGPAARAFRPLRFDRI